MNRAYELRRERQIDGFVFIFEIGEDGWGQIFWVNGQYNDFVIAQTAQVDGLAKRNASNFCAISLFVVHRANDGIGSQFFCIGFCINCINARCCRHIESFFSANKCIVVYFHKTRLEPSFGRPRRAVCFVADYQIERAKFAARGL